MKVEISLSRLVFLGILSGAAGGATAGLVLTRPGAAAPAPSPQAPGAPATVLAEAPPVTVGPAEERPAPAPPPAPAEDDPAAAPTAERLRQLEAFLLRYQSPSGSSLDHALRIPAEQTALRWIWFQRSLQEGDAVALIHALELLRDARGGRAPGPGEASTHDWLRVWVAFREPADLARLVALAGGGDDLALMYLAHLRTWKLAVDVDETWLLESLLRASGEGDPRAMHALATVAGRSPKRREWLEKAAQAGHPLALQQLVGELESSAPADALRWGLRGLEEHGMPLSDSLARAAGQLSRRGAEPELVEKALTAILATATSGYTALETRLIRAQARARAGDRAGAAADLASVLRQANPSRGDERFVRQAEQLAAQEGIGQEELAAASSAEPAQRPDLGRLEARREEARRIPPREDGPDPPLPEELAEWDQRLPAAEPEPVRMASQDGLELEGELWRREGSTVAVVLLHQSGAGRASWRPLARALLAAGDASVLAIDRRGQGGSRRRGQEQLLAAGEAAAALLRQEPQDVRAALDWMRAAGIDTGQVLLCGAGSGASAAILAAGELPGLVALLLLSPHPAYLGVDVRPALTKVAVPLLVYAAEEDDGLAAGLDALLEHRPERGALVLHMAGGAHGTRLLTAPRASGRAGRTLVGGGRTGVQMWNDPVYLDPIEGTVAFLRAVLAQR